MLLAEREKTPLQISPAQTPSQPANETSVKAGENPADPFRVGVTWVGEAKAGNRTAKWAVSISERDGQRFSGGMVTVAPNGDKFEMPISGTARIATMVWSSWRRLWSAEPGTSLVGVYKMARLP